MKKFALFSLMCCLGAMNASYATCGPSTLGFDGTQKPDHDEFLYETEYQFNLTKSGYENSNHQNSGYGKGYECDTIDSAGCPNRKTVTLKAGHVFKGKVVSTQKTYKCTINLFQDDMWVEQAGEACEACETKWGDLCVGKSFANKTFVDCSGLNVTENNVDTVETWQVICRPGKSLVCKPTKCKDGYKLDDKNGKCIKDCKDCDKQKPQPQNCPAGQTRATKDIIVTKVCSGDKCVAIKKGQCYDTGFLKCMEAADRGEPANWNGKSCNCGDKMVWDPKNYKCNAKSGGGNVTPQKSCKDSRKTQTGKACCDVPKTQATYDEKTDKCNCLVPNAVFDIIQGKGQCVVKETPVVEGECNYYIKAGIKCANGNYYLEEGYQKVKRSDFEGKTCDEITQILDNDVNRLINTFKEYCKEKQSEVYVVPPQTGPSEREVEQAQSVLSAFTTSAKDEASVWKTAEGNFNGARLASDITAGVVLGTVGGVVTGNIIKKNQVKKGFEALHCTVGGQKVADWGDEFSVGLQR